VTFENQDITEIRPDVSAVTTDKDIDAAQLAAELGTDQVWIDGRRILAAVDRATLEAAVAAHVVDPYFGEPDEQRQLGALETKMRAVWAGTETFTPAQVQRLLAGLGLLALRTAKRSKGGPTG
jgi:hypothetical protein